MKDISVIEVQATFSDAERHSKASRHMAIEQLAINFAYEALLSEQTTEIVTPTEVVVSIRGAYLSETQIIRYLQDKAELTALRKRYSNE